MDLKRLAAHAGSGVLAVGSTVIDLTPTPVKEWAVREFGTADKPILIGSVVVGTLLLAAAAGVLARRSFRLAAGLLLGLVARSPGRWRCGVPSPRASTCCPRWRRPWSA